MCCVWRQLTFKTQHSAHGSCREPAKFRLGVRTPFCGERMMRGFAKSLFVAAALTGAHLAAAQSPSNRGGPGGSAQPALGTGSCSGALGAEPRCPRPPRGSSAEQGGNWGAEDNDQVGSHTPSTDRMGPNAGLAGRWRDRTVGKWRQRRRRPRRRTKRALREGPGGPGINKKRPPSLIAGAGVSCARAGRGSSGTGSRSLPPSKRRGRLPYPWGCIRGSAESRWPL
jgi:hypothetical protein